MPFLALRRHASLLAAGLAVLALSGCAGASAVPGAAPTLAGLPSFAPLVRRVLPSVVNIAVTETVPRESAEVPLPPDLRDTPLGREFQRRFKHDDEQVTGAGSGYIIDPSGVIVTNDHVVGHASRIVVSLSDGTELPAHLIGSDALTDIAVIKVDAGHPLPAVTWGDSRAMAVGDWVIAAGNPFGLGGTVTAGIVSAEGRDIGAGPFDNFLQLDAPINPGNSGGPVFDMAGQVVGMTTAIVSPTGGSVGIGFAIPSDAVRGIVAALRAHGHIDRGWLGVSVQSVPAAPDHPAGVQIGGVEPGGPAAKAGLRAGDVVQAVNGRRVTTAQLLIRAIAAVAPGGVAKLDVARAGTVLHVAVTVGLRPANE
ncbi:MAG: trypsin-like peptidase domain-containing protein [Rhodospirillales bacterium]|nr:trypsin-like peptidase domain-containing protein [Rhodospirillales bacterium]